MTRDPHLRRGRVVRLSVTARLDERGDDEDEAARLAGPTDEAWTDWLAQLGHGEVATVRLQTRAQFLVAGRRGEVEVVNEGVWLERAVHAPVIEEQVREIAYKDVAPLCAALRAQGLNVDEHDLGDMYFHVDLPAALVDALVTPVRSLAGSAARPPADDETPADLGTPH